MSLIEQLGYNECKLVLSEKRYDDVSYSANSNNYYKYLATEHGANDITNLEDDLLEYRKQNNIFEIGDFVYMYEGNVLQQVENVSLFFIDVGVGFMHSSNFRHATDKEIAQGYRDE